MGFSLFMLAAVLAAPSDSEGALARYQFFQIEMAAPIKIVLYAKDEAAAERAAKAAFARFRELNGVMSDYDPESELRRLCDTSREGKPVRVSDDLWRVLVRAQALSEQSDGAFDVSVGPIVRLWRRARRQQEMPSAERIAEAKASVGYRAIRLDAARQTVELTKPNMRLDLGGIAAGYAVDEALKVLAAQGITCALVDASGDIGLGDAPPGKEGWTVAIEALDPNEPPQQIVSLARCAISTSGDTQQFVELGGRRYSHIVDPRTGLGLTDHSSVTVVARDAITADALASAVSVLGPEKGISLVDKTPGAAALVMRAPEGKMEVYESCRWKELAGE